ncbi:MAG: efflux RND transporter permease subunit [Thermoanaerobaculales bacterium]|jgi:HAE1 family hydrophobic/amphiphilic exporter-1|nr:efflux RND transporter permease subunit [Thermoanaerobaculales bacterium]
MRALVALAVRRRVTVLMCALAVAAFGVVGYQRLPLDLLPDISYPSLTVQTDFPDTAPAEVENLITRPVEEAVGVLRGLRTVHSVSRPGVSEVTLEFDWGADMDLLLLDVREKLDRLILPEEAEDPVVLRFDPSLDPIVRIALGGKGDLTESRRLADRRLKQAFESLPGVASARVKGGLEEEIHVEVDQERLAALGIPLERLRQVVGVSNLNLPGGSLRGADTQYLIRTVNEYTSVEEIGDLVLSSGGASQVRVRDVAEVSWGARERTEIIRVGGVEAVEIAIYKEGDANIVTTAREIRESLPEMTRLVPEGYELTVLFDQSRFIEQALAEVRVSAVIGGALAILVLFVFLRDLRSTVIIATAIPLSVLFTFMAMYRLEVSLNIMSLGGLTLGIGMLVDNAIVVLESIDRKRQEGLDRTAAAVTGTAEVGAAVVASTLTTVAVFLPIVFVEGIAGALFGDMAVTVTLSLLASLVVAVTLIPMLAALGDDDAAGAGAGRAAETGTLGALSRFYDAVLHTALDRRWPTLAGAALVLALSLAALGGLESSLIPDISQGEFTFEATLPEGTSVLATDRVLQRMASPIVGDPAVEVAYATAGSRLVSGGLSLSTTAEHYGQLNVVLADRNDEAVEQEVAGRLRDGFASIPELETTFGKPTYFSLKTPIEVILFSDDLEALSEWAPVLADRLAAVPGLVDVRSSLEEGNPELQVIFDRDRLASLGLDMGEVARTLRDRVLGAVPTRFREADRQIDIRVRNLEDQRRTAADVRNLMIPGPDGRQLRLLTVAEVRAARGPAEIHRVQQQRAAVLTANLEGRGLGAVVRDIRALLAANPPPAGVTAELGGQVDEMQTSFASLRFAMALAIFLVYLVMAATFESLVHPFVVLFTIPLALVGVVIGLLVTRTEVSVIALIGAVMLVGIVVNNAIVFIDTVNQLRRRGLDKLEAVVRGGHLRLRPILMTTLTTVLGLLPMALSLGEGAELRAPLAITVSFGLTFSTLLTLVVIPAVYLVVPSRVRLDHPAVDPDGGPA